MELVSAPTNVFQTTETNMAVDHRTITTNTLSAFNHQRLLGQKKKKSFAAKVRENNVTLKNSEGYNELLIFGTQLPIIDEIKALFV